MNIKNYTIILLTMLAATLEWSAMADKISTPVSLTRWEPDWRKVGNYYSMEGEIYRYQGLSLSEAKAIADADPSVIGFLIIHRDVFITSGRDYASDTDVLFDAGDVIFLGSKGAWRSHAGVEAYVKYNKLIIPDNYGQYQLSDYLNSYKESFVKKAIHARRIGISIEDAFRIAENDPLITHFIQVPEWEIKRSFGNEDGIPWTPGEFIFLSGLPEWIKTISPMTFIVVKK